MKNFLAIVGAGVVLLAIFACALFGTWVANNALDAGQIQTGVDRLVVTLEAVEAPVIYTEDTRTQQPDPVVVVETVIETVIVEVTGVSPPTATPIIVLDSRGLPPSGPYSLDEVQQCKAIITNGNLDTLPSPQRELCVMYVGANNGQ